MICENEKCGKEHDGSFGSGRFCCRACANSVGVSSDDKTELKTVACSECGSSTEVNKRTSLKFAKCTACSLEKVVTHPKNAFRYPESIKTKARNLRADGMSQKDIAAHLDISKVTISRWTKDVITEGPVEDLEGYVGNPTDTTDMTSKEKGDMSEGAILGELVKKSYTALIPFGDKNRYDLVVDLNNTFIRIQCKTGLLKKSAIYFSCKSVYTGTDGKQVSMSYTKKEIDYYMIYCPQLDRVYCVPVEDGTNTGMSLRLSGNPNGNRIKWAKDYEFRGF